MNESEQNLVSALHSLFFRVVSMHPDDFLPETLYHYTSAAGLYGIISSGQLWGANYSYLNDPSELAYGRKVALQVIAEKLEAEEEKQVKSFLKRIHGRLATAAGTLDFYLTCFCKTPDLLSQWRGYGTESGGFCVGFNADALLYESKVVDNVCGSVVYELNWQQKKVGLAIVSTCEALMKGRANNRSFRAALAAELVQKLLEELCFFKHVGFEEEKEWRIVHFAANASAVHFKAH